MRPHLPTAPYLRIAEAVSVTGCAGAEVIPAIGAEPRKLRCRSFTAELLDAVPHSDSEGGYEDLTPTGQIVDVWHKFTDPMEPDATITIALRPDGRWTLLVWACD